MGSKIGHWTYHCIGILKKCVPTKKESQVWNDMRASKHFWENYPLALNIYLVSKCILCLIRAGLSF